MTGVAIVFGGTAGRSDAPLGPPFPVQLEALLLERLGKACTDSRDLLLWEFLLEECSDGQTVFAQEIQIRPSSELYAQVQWLIRTTWEGAAHLDAWSIF